MWAAYNATFGQEVKKKLGEKVYDWEFFTHLVSPIWKPGLHLRDDLLLATLSRGYCWPRKTKNIKKVFKKYTKKMQKLTCGPKAATTKKQCGGITCRQQWSQPWLSRCRWCEKRRFLRLVAGSTSADLQFIIWIMMTVLTRTERGLRGNEMESQE